MSSVDRRLAILGVTAVAASAVSGCFRPMLAEGTPASTTYGQFALPDVEGRFGYYLVESLRDRLGVSDAPRWALSVTSVLEERRFSVSQDNATTRITLVATGTWSVTPEAGGDPVESGEAVTQAGYNATGSLFATRQLRRDIERRLARDLGERIARAVLAQTDPAGS